MENIAGPVKVTIQGVSGNVPSPFYVSYIIALEMIHIIAMAKWQDTAPSPGQYGWRGDIWMENSQQARLQYLLEGIGLHDPDRVYGVIATETRRPRTNESSVTRARPVQSLALNDRWYLDACLSLPQKFQVVETLKHLGFSQTFIETAKCFVAGTPLRGEMAA